MTNASENVDPRLLECLVDPGSRGGLHLDAARHELVCRATGRAYPVRHGIPILLVDEARTIEKGKT
ncbi:MAG: hypothetical protein A2018_00405 [Alphaproteobacteria bacterium GWF2_58_20]|nr:MAG: hypothetical protein A2018_00405 [Alphaproteobacteria bacterium GWF2_58_20]